MAARRQGQTPALQITAQAIYRSSALLAAPRG
jgi:hypothetical protein